MARVNFHTQDFLRQVANPNGLILKNRYFEQNPFLSTDNQGLQARPGMRNLTTVGSGPIRGLASEAGSFNGDLFIASGSGFYRMDNLLNQTSIYSGLYNPEQGSVSMAITATIGDTVPAFTFLADGRNLFVYTDNGYARNQLTGSGTTSNVVDIDGVYYQWATDITADADGTSTSPWLIAVTLTSTPEEYFYGLYLAINAGGVAGTDYSSGLTQNPNVHAVSYSSSSMSVAAKVAGVLYNSTVTTVTGSGLSWANGGTLTGGGDPDFSQVMLPLDVGAIDVAVINSYVIVIPTQSDGNQGVFYWINPGEIVVDPLNYATAERSPDGLYGVQVFNDQFYLLGESTVEVWYVNSSYDPTGTTATSESAMLRMQGVVIDRGSWQNTGKAIHEQMILVDADGGVFLVQSGTPQRVSTPNIEEQIRVSISNQTSSV